MENLGILEMTSEQIEGLCVVTEGAARKHVCSRVPKRRLESLNIWAEAKGTKPVNLRVDIRISLSLLMNNINVQRLVDEALKAAFSSAERYLRELACRSHR